MNNHDWMSSAQMYLAKLGASEYASHVRKNGKKSRIRFSPSGYMRDLVELLGKGDEEGFKSLKGECGYASELGH